VTAGCVLGNVSGAPRRELAARSRPGQVVGVVGPNGAGKTTLLRLVAGLVAATDGFVSLGTEVLDDGATRLVPAERRPVSVVFQDYRLFPHLRVIDNVAFGPRSRGASRASARTSARSWLDRLDLSEFADRRPSELSGGQAQRVALARALAAGPQVLLLDEPLAALDAQTRPDVRSWLRRHLHDFDGVSLLVTHDPLEALILCDQLVVLEEGRVTQVGAPAEVARRPASSYVASLVGLNLYRGISDGSGSVAIDSGARVVVPAPAPAGDVLLTFRPSSVAVFADEPQGGSARNVWPGVVSGVEMLGDRVRLRVDGAVAAYADVTAAAVAQLGLAPGREVWAAVKSTEIDVYPQPRD
jgi:molybdate transport system ATP-binding protein